MTDSYEREGFAGLLGGHKIEKAVHGGATGLAAFSDPVDRQVWDTTAAAVVFPFVEQAARLTRCIDSNRHPAEKIQTEYLLCSRPASALDARHMLAADRLYWGIETGLHLRLDAIADEDRSRVRHRTSALNLAMMRRAVISLETAGLDVTAVAFTRLGQGRRRFRGKKRATDLGKVWRPRSFHKTQYPPPRKL